jgi:ribosome-binding factor A
VGHSKKPRRGRAHRAPADALFERALLRGDRDRGRKFEGGRDRKTLQLCRQVQRALSLALAGECGDELLRDAFVEDVEPLGGAGQLLVRVTVPPNAGAAPGEVLARLAALAPRLRAVVAGEICRKRVPVLSFVVVPASTPAAAGEGGGRDE